MKRGTNYSTGGLGRITRLVPQVKVRVFGFVAVVIFGSILLGWITHSLWVQLDELQKDHAAVKSETFYFGVQLRGGLRALNEKLLQYGISQDPTFRDSFLKDSADLRSWLSTNQMLLAETANLQLMRSADISKQLRITAEISTNYDLYSSEAQKLLSETNMPSGTNVFEITYKTVRAISSRLFPLCDDLVTSQREGFGEFLRGTQVTLANHQRLLTISSVLIVALMLVLAVQVYRGMIAPLRRGLSQSRSIIERQEKLAALGILGSGVAHEIRNPLTAIKFRLFSLRKAHPDMMENEDIGVISGEINRLEKIVQHFLQFARPSEPRLTRVDLDKVLLETAHLFRPELESTAIEILVEAKGPAQAYADAEQIKQVLVNLVKNAAESIGKSGSITLGLRRERVELHGRSRPAAILSVADTGKGIPSAIEARLFDPFFTTKERGTGLGLSISTRIAEKHGGLLTYETVMDKGTTFELILPAI